MYIGEAYFNGEWHSGVYLNWKILIDLLPLDDTTKKLVKSVSQRRSGYEEEAVYRVADHWVFDGSRGGGGDAGIADSAHEVQIATARAGSAVRRPCCARASSSAGQQHRMGIKSCPYSMQPKLPDAYRRDGPADAGFPAPVQLAVIACNRVLPGRIQ